MNVIDDTTQIKPTIAPQLRKLTYNTPVVRTIDDYICRDSDKIGEGTYGTVLRAKDKRTNEIVALKRILISQKEDGLPITAVREIKLLKSLNHENIVTLKDIVLDSPSNKNQEREYVYLVFEFMDHDLSGLSKTEGKNFIPGQIGCYAKQLLEGLYFCHKKKVLHRDIKGANLLVNSEGILKIADFGLARKMKEDSRYTKPVVTLWYRAPELLLGTSKYSEAIDMWSVGCLLAELYINHPLFPGKEDPDQIYKIYELCGTPSDDNWPEGKNLHKFNQFKPKTHRTRSLAQFLRHNSRNITDDAVDLIDKLLSLDPNKRPSAEKALDHPFFYKNDVLAIADLPKYTGKSLNELSSKRSRDFNVTREEPPYKRSRGNSYQRNHNRNDYGNRSKPYNGPNRQYNGTNRSYNGTNRSYNGPNRSHNDSNRPYTGGRSGNPEYPYPKFRNQRYHKNNNNYNRNYNPNRYNDRDKPRNNDDINLPPTQTQLPPQDNKDGELGNGTTN